MLFSICTPHRNSHKWDVGPDGLVEYGEVRITPREALERFLVEYPMFTVIRADVCQRLTQPSDVTGRDYTWVELERLM